MSIKFYPEIILRASTKNKNVGAFRVYSLAKNFDNGSGFIPAKKFRNHLKLLEIPRGTFYRWLDAALSMGLMAHQKTRKGVKVYSLVAWERAAALAGVSRLQRPVTMPVSWMVGKGWTARIWAAWVKHYEGPKARKTFEVLTGVPARTQREYESQAGVENVANYADLGDAASDPDNAWFTDNKNGVYTDPKTGRQRRRLPNTRHTPEEITLANKGRTRQRNRNLEALYEVDSSPMFTGRLYCKDDKQVKKAIRQDKKQDARTRQDVIYRFICEKLVGPQQVGIYEAITL